MAKVKVEVLDAFVDGKGKGEQISVEEKSADHLEKIGYVKRIAEGKPKTTPKKQPTKKAEAKSEDNE